MGRTIFGKVIIALALMAVSAAANAVNVVLIVHNQTSGSGAVSSLITDGSHIQGQPASTAVWDWDGTTLSSTGLYSAVSSIGSSAYSATILNDQITNLNIDTSTTSTAGTTSYNCVEGTFLGSVGAHGCGGYTLGTNFTSDSTTIWTGLSVAQTIGGDDVLTAGPRTISAYDFGTVTLISGASTTTPGAVFEIGNGIEIGVPNLGGEAMFFTVVGPGVGITIPGGSLQECSITNGSPVDFQAAVELPPDDEVSTIEWFLDGASVGFGENLTTFVSLGSHTIEVVANTMLGESFSDAEQIKVQDTTAPNISIAFTDNKGTPITGDLPSGPGLVNVNYSASDLCDQPTSIATALGGGSIANGDTLRVTKKDGSITLKVTELKVRVTATDASGNVAEREESL